MEQDHSLLDYCDAWEAGSVHDSPLKGRTDRIASLNTLFADAGFCPFCRRPAPRVFGDGAYYTYENPEDDEHVSVEIRQCDCGWWDLSKQVTPNGRNEYTEEAWHARWVGVLRRFDPKKLDLPLEVLRRAAAADPSILDYIHASTFERYVGALLSDHLLKCEVRHCGRTGDGGIDLFAIDSDQPIAIQVKRRENLAVGEGVAAVRELVGAMVGEKYLRGMFVTTRHFTKAATEYAAAVVDSPAVSEFTLIDGNMLLTLFHLETQSDRPSWYRHLPYPIQEVYGIPSDKRGSRHGAWSRLRNF